MTVWFLDWVAPSIPGPRVSTREAIGIAVAICGNVLISFALNLQKLAHRRIELKRQHVEQPSVHTSTEEDCEDDHSASDEVEARVNSVRDAPRDQWTPSRILETVPLLQQRSFESGSYGSPMTGVLPFGTSSPRRRRFPMRMFFRRKSTPKSPPMNHPNIILTPATPGTGSPSQASDDDTTYSDERNPSPTESTRSVVAHQETDYLKTKLWWLGFLLMNVGEIGNFLAYAFAPASVVAPLGTFALVANCVFAPMMLHEHFRKSDMLGIACAIIGAVTVVLASNPSYTVLDPSGLKAAIMQWQFLVFTVAYIVAGSVLAALSGREGGQRWVWIDVGLCAIFGGFTVLSTKAVSTLLTTQGTEVFTEWIFYPLVVILIATGLGQIRYLNRALMRFDSKLVIPGQFVLFNLSAIVGSAILYQDFRRVSFHQMVTFLYGCAATFAGVWLISWRPTEQPSGAQSSGGLTQGPLEELNVNTGPVPRNAIPREVPTLSNRTSVVSLIGFSPAQRILLLHSPPREGMNLRMLHDLEHDGSVTPTRPRAVNFAVIEGDGSPRAPGRASHPSGRSRSGSQE
ncbi:DUF803-domain-containing protein [Punctularia strigosozonata HHB-11173 SS5]|uniref:DUF803-domain-containing protein n=1 Tax=Punctularia strigosozonata (strain HHB-11173) TaxID=741275 RepID=UPI00044181FC|nr:DUF803-domain-containing protein [Punctularia strigosozonata HHB-11173 SS5]EIN10604.1 DUF803-domain-containing protein [Punctularia strigosozonata HHB-11173 SS5]